jgi:hypothetical protein
MSLAEVFSTILSDHREDPWSIDALRERISPLTDAQLSILVKSMRQRLEEMAPEERLKRGEIEAIPEKPSLAFECDQSILGAALVEVELRRRRREDEEFEDELAKYEQSEEEIAAGRDLAAAEERLKVIESAKVSCRRQAEEQLRTYEAERLRKERTSLGFRRKEAEEKWRYFRFGALGCCGLGFVFFIHASSIAVNRNDKSQSFIMSGAFFFVAIILTAAYRKLSYVPFVDTDEEGMVRAIELRADDLMVKWEQAQERQAKAEEERATAYKADKKARRKRARRQQRRADATRQDNIMKELEEQKRLEDDLLAQADRALNCPTPSSSESEQFSSSSGDDFDDENRLGGGGKRRKQKKKWGAASLVTAGDMQAALLDSDAADDAIPHYRGVTRVGNDCWEARMNENGERVSLGFCDTAAEAARLYDRSARKHPGWPLNFPEEEAERVKREAERLLKDEEARKAALRKEVEAMAALAEGAKKTLYEVEFDNAMERHDVEHAAAAAVGLEATKGLVPVVVVAAAAPSPTKQHLSLSPTSSARIAPESHATNEALADLQLVGDIIGLLDDPDHGDDHGDDHDVEAPPPPESSSVEAEEEEGGPANDIIPPRQKDYDDVQFVWEAASQGDPRAQHTLGLMYRKGEGGLDMNEAEAIKWLRKAGDQGYVHTAL